MKPSVTDHCFQKGWNNVWRKGNLIYTQRRLISLENSVPFWLIAETDGRRACSVMSSSLSAHVHVWLRVSFCLNPVLHPLTVPVESHVLHLLLFDVCHLKEMSCLVPLCLER